MKFKVSLRLVEDLPAEEDHEFHPLPLVHSRRKHVQYGHEDDLAHEANHELVKRITTVMYLVLMLLLVSVLLMELKRSYGFDLIPGFKSPLEDFYFDLFDGF